VVRQGSKGYEAVIDLAQHKQLSWKELRGEYPNMILPEEGVDAGKEAKKDAAVTSALKRRGVTDLPFFDCFVGALGYFGTPEERGKRIFSVMCSDQRRMYSSWSREIPGFMVMFDADTRKVLRVVDEGGSAPADAFLRYEAPSAAAPREVSGPIRVDQ